MDQNPIQRAVDAAGGAKALGAHFDMTPEAVRLWVKAGRVPAKRVLDVERITGVSRHDLNPDIYPQDAQHEARA